MKKDNSVIKILDCRVNVLSLADLRRIIVSEKGTISKINSEFVLRGIRSKKFSRLINGFDYNIIDGRGVQWSARYLTLPISNNKIFRLIQAIWQMIYSGAAIVFSPNYIRYPIKEVIPWVGAFELMLTEAEKSGIGVFFFGSSQGVLEKAVKNLKKNFPRLMISGILNGYDYQKNSLINPVDIINKTDAELLFVALGSPKQEYWIHENLSQLKNIKVAVGEGGTLDRIANPSQKAPKFINKIGLEWLWRLLFNKSQTETRNRWGRFWNSVPIFIYEVVKWKIKYGAIKVE